MDEVAKRYRRILVAIDFSAASESALRRAIWLATQSGAQLTVIHVLLDRPGVALFEPGIGGIWEGGNGTVEVPLGIDQVRQQAALADAESRLRKLLAGQSTQPAGIDTRILVGEPFVEITRFAIREKVDLVVTGSRGLSAWEQFLVGSTATKVIRKCPGSVWIEQNSDVSGPRRVLVATDFSDLSRIALREAAYIAGLAGGELQVLHVIDALDLPDGVVASTPEGDSVRDRINEHSKRRLDDFIASAQLDPNLIQRRLSWGTPWKEIGNLAKHHEIDLVVIGTVGRSGIRGMLLGNTADRLLRTCHCGILTVKDPDFVSPIHEGLTP